MDLLQLMPRPKKPNYVKAAQRRWTDPDYRSRVIEAKRKAGNAHMVVQAHSEESRRKRSNTLKRKWKSPEYRKRISDALKKRLADPVFYAAQMERLRKYVHENPETHRKISQSLRRKAA